MFIPPPSSLQSYFDAFGQFLVDKNLERVFIHLPGQPKWFFPTRQSKKTLLPSGRKRLALVTGSHKVKFSLQLKAQWSYLPVACWPSPQYPSYQVSLSRASLVVDLFSLIAKANLLQVLQSLKMKFQKTTHALDKQYVFVTDF